MTKANRKNEQREIIQKAKLKRRQQIWNPDLPEKELAEFKVACESMKRELDRVSRPASVAYTKHGDILSRSHVGGTALYRRKNWPFSKNREWPRTKRGPMTLVLELFIEELPFIPPALKGKELLQLFLDLEISKSERACADERKLQYNDGPWHIRTFDSLEGLAPVSKGEVLEGFNFSWGLEKTVPTYPDNLDAIDQKVSKAFETLPNSSELYLDMTKNSFGGLKVGGWPTWLHGSDIGDFVLQLESQFVGLDLGFDEIIFIGRNRGKWDLAWEVG